MSSSSKLEKQKLAEAVSAPGASPVPVEEFKPLGDRVRAEQELLFGVETQALLKRWQNEKSTSLGADSADIEQWKRDLSAERVARYLTSTAALARSLILESDSKSGRIESRSEAPYFEVFARPNSVLAREQGLKNGGPVRLHQTSIATHIGSDARVSPAWGEYAWRAIAVSIGDAPHSLPRLSIQTEGNALTLDLTD